MATPLVEKDPPSSAPAASPLLKTTLSLVLLQLVSRLFSFSLNQLLLRSTTPQALGVATMGLEVVRDTGLFLVREGVRGAVVRNRSSTTRSPLLSQTLLLPTLLSPLILLLFFAYSFLPPSPLPPFFHLTTSLYALSALFELLAERFYLETLLDWEGLTGARVRVEGMAVGGKAVGTLLTIMWGGERCALVAFGAGQVVYGAVLLLGLGWSVGRKVEWAWPRKVEGGKVYFDPATTELSWALTKQSFVKQFLTEGDKIVVGRLSKVEDQGGYAIALNYGSLIARILFQPLEETSRLFFSRSLSLPTCSTLLSSSSLLSSLLLLHTHLSLILTLLAPSYTSPLLYHLLGPRWSASSAPVILRAYCFYLPFLAINGITEAFFQSVASGFWLRRGSLWMGACSVGFIGAVVAGVKAGMGETGLVYANCVNMSMRIAFSSLFIRSFFVEATAKVGLSKGEEEEVWRNVGWRSWMPKVGTLGVFGAAWMAVKWSEERWDWRTVGGLGRHVGVGAVAGIACLGVIYWSEKEALRRLARVVRKKTD